MYSCLESNNVAELPDVYLREAPCDPMYPEQDEQGCP